MSSMSVKTVAAMTALSVVLAAVVSGCGNGSSGNQSSNSSTSGAAQTGSASANLLGAGSTLIAPAMSTWTAAYKQSTGTDIQYGAIGSGGGISQLINHTVDFAGSDAPMNSQEIADAKQPVIHLPAVIGAAAIAYNIAGVQTGLKLTGPVIADIYLGKITQWDDPKIVALNPGVKLPNTAITVTHRTDGSGTTFIFTDYLCKVSPDWKSKVGNGKSVEWPVGLGGKGSEGVAGLLQKHDGSIGYVELAYAMDTKIPYASVQNPSGAFVAPSSDSASAAAAGVKLPDTLTGSITNGTGASAYPIAGFSYLIVYQTTQESAKADSLKKFLQWVLKDGQTIITAQSYGPIPADIVKQELAKIDAIQ